MPFRPYSRPEKNLPRIGETHVRGLYDGMLRRATLPFLALFPAVPTPWWTPSPSDPSWKLVLWKPRSRAAPGPPASVSLTQSLITQRAIITHVLFFQDYFKHISSFMLIFLILHRMPTSEVGHIPLPFLHPSNFLHYSFYYLCYLTMEYSLLSRVYYHYASFLIQLFFFFPRADKLLMF